MKPAHNLRHWKTGNALVSVPHRGEDNHHLTDGVKDGDVEDCVKFS